MIRVFTDEGLVKFQVVPRDHARRAIRFFILTPAELEFVGSGRGSADRFGRAVQLCKLPWLGFVPDDVASAPAAAVARLSEPDGGAAP